MKRVCAWCAKEMEGSKSEDKRVTHGICRPCYDDLMDKARSSATDRKAVAIKAEEVVSLKS